MTDELRSVWFHTTEDVLELTRGLKREPNVSTALHIIQWDLGDLTKAVVYKEWHDDSSFHLQRSWTAEARSALASILFQVLVVAELMGFDFEELFNLGVDIVKERIEDVEKRRGRFQYYIGDKHG